MEFSYYIPCYWPDISYPADRMYREVIEQAQIAEDVGFCAFGVPEHHFMNYLTHPSALLTAVRVAAATRRVPIVTSVLVLPFRDMRCMAGEVAQADCLMDGRLQIGVGRGAFRYEFDRLGVPWQESRERFDDALALLEALFTRDEVSWDSKWYRFPPLSITPKPVQKPMPPIWIGAVTPEAIYHSARRGYHVQTTPLRAPFEFVQAQADAFHRGNREGGEAARGKRLSMLRMVYVAKDRADARAKAEIAHANHQRFANVYDSPGDIEGGAIKPVAVKESVDDVQRALIIDTADGVIEKLTPYAKLGIHEMIVNMGFGANHRDTLGSLERFAREVMPAMARVRPSDDVVAAAQVGVQLARERWSEISRPPV